VFWNQTEQGGLTSLYLPSNQIFECWQTFLPFLRMTLLPPFFQDSLLTSPDHSALDTPSSAHSHSYHFTAHLSSTKNNLHCFHTCNYFTGSLMARSARAGLVHDCLAPNFKYPRDESNCFKSLRERSKCCWYLRTQFLILIVKEVWIFISPET
jgi:hypothetical protein